MTDQAPQTAEERDSLLEDLRYELSTQIAALGGQVATMFAMSSASNRQVSDMGFREFNSCCVDLLQHVQSYLMTYNEGFVVTESIVSEVIGNDRDVFDEEENQQEEDAMSAFTPKGTVN